MQAGTWCHLAFSFGESRMKLHLNGQLVGENEFTGGIQGSREPIVIGGSLSGNYRDTNDLSKLYIRKPFNGYIDEVAIYDEALASAQIGQLISRGSFGVITG